VQIWALEANSLTSALTVTVTVLAVPDLKKYKKMFFYFTSRQALRGIISNLV